LQSSCNVLARNVSLQSALHVAAAACDASILPLILPHCQAIINAPDKNCQTPLLLSLQAKVFRQTPHAFSCIS
jgi:hypothetical protein